MIIQCHVWLREELNNITTVSALIAESITKGCLGVLGHDIIFQLDFKFGLITAFLNIKRNSVPFYDLLIKEGILSGCPIKSWIYILVTISCIVLVDNRNRIN